MPKHSEFELLQEGYIYTIPDGSQPAWATGGGHRGAYGNHTGTTGVDWAIDDLVSQLSPCSASLQDFRICSQIELPIS